jgi:sterol 3beta-glucosyltransferase
MGPMTDHRGRAVPILHGFSPLLCPRPADWPASAVVTGHWPLLVSDAELASGVSAFLDDGPPPVYVGFGSMAGRDPERTAREVVAALRRAGCRGLLAGGWGGYG